MRDDNVWPKSGTSSSQSTTVGAARGVTGAESETETIPTNGGGIKTVRSVRSKLPTRSRRTHRTIFGILAQLENLGLSSITTRLLLLAFCSFVSGLSQAGVLVIVSEQAVNRVQRGANLKLYDLTLSLDQSIVICGILLVLFAIASMSAAFASSAMSSSSVEGCRGNIISSFFEASWEVQSAERLGHIQQLLTVNSESVGWVTLGISNGVQALLSVSALLLAAFLVNPLAAGVVLAAGLVLSTVLRPFLQWSRNASTRLSNDSQRMATQVTEYTRLTREFRLLGVEKEATGRLAERNHDAAMSLRKSRLLTQISPVVYQTLALGLVVIGLLFLVTHSGHNIGATGAVLLLSLRSLTYGSVIQSTSQSLRSYEGFLEGIEADISTYRSSKPRSTGVKLPETFNISLEDVWFAYDGENHVVKGVSFNLPSGRILGVVGRSGSGKTTLSQLILGMRSPHSGSVLVGGVLATSVEKGNGVSPVALVPQEPILLQGSIKSNIAFFREVSQDDVERASRAAHLHEDVITMPKLYETLVGEGGGALSGGQKQRLAIARALVGSPRVLILDEPTSALDGRSENLIRRTLTELREHVTVVVISHRLATVGDCDFLLVLEDGSLAAFGTREDVMSVKAFRNAAELT